MVSVWLKGNNSQTKAEKLSEREEKLLDGKKVIRESPGELTGVGRG